MKIAVYGIWHLGAVTAVCLADKGFEVIALDDDKNNVDNLQKSIPPLFEPGLTELIKKNNGKNLKFTSDKREISSADIVWICFDTPVDNEDNADVDFVINKICSIFEYLKEDCVVLISSQLPVTTTRKIKNIFNSNYNKKMYFAYSPENLRLGKAIEIFNNPERIIIGIDDDKAKSILNPVLQKYSDNLIYMSVESAEMVKHGINSFLAISVTYINEIASICEEVGADASEVEKGLRSEPRIGQKAYIKPGGAFAGGTLARDIKFLNKTATEKNIKIPMLAGIIESNNEHINWPYKILVKKFGDLKGKKISVLGLTYKPNTGTLRRSSSLYICKKLLATQAEVSAFEPNITELPKEFSQIVLYKNISETFKNADAVIICTEHSILKEQNYQELINSMKNKIILDQNKFIYDFLPKNINFEHYNVGSKTVK